MTPDRKPTAAAAATQADQERRQAEDVAALKKMSDQELIKELKKRGYAVMRNKEKEDLVTATLIARLPRA